MLVSTTLLCCAIAAEPPAAGFDDVDLLDERAWVESVSRRRQTLASAPAPVEVVLIDDLLKSPARNLPDRLRYTPGVDVYQLRHGHYEVGLRGYNGPFNNRVLVLYDGWRFQQDTGAFVTWTGAIDYSDLERIEVAKGPGSVTYGDNAFGGVISLTSRPVGDRTRLDVVGRIDDPAGGEADATLSGPITGIWYGKLGAGYLRLNDLPAADSHIPGLATRRNTVNDTLDTEAWRARALLGARLAEGWAAEGQVRVWRRSPYEVVDGWTYGSPTMNIADDQLTLEMKGPWLRLGHLERHNEIDFLNLKPQYDPTSDFLYNQYGFRNRQRITRAQVTLRAGGHVLGVGAERSYWTSRSNLWVQGADYHDDGTWKRVDTANNALFAEDQWRLAPAWQLTAGMRYDRDEIVGGNASPRLALNWTPSQRSYALLALSSGYRLPSPLERFENDYFLQPTSDLRAETIRAVETQWRWRDGGTEVSAGGWLNRSNDLIWRLPLPLAEQQANFNTWAAGGFDPTRGPGPMFQFANLDNPVTVLGAELGARHRVERTPCTLWANGTWTHYRMRDEVRFQSPGFDPGDGNRVYEYDFTLPRDTNAPPAWKGSLGLDYEDERWFGTAALRLASGRYVYDPGHTRLFRNFLPAVQDLDPYAVVDLSLGLRLGRGRFVRLSVIDVADSNHTEYYRPSAESLAAGGESQMTSDLGRMWSLAAGWTF